MKQALRVLLAVSLLALWGAATAQSPEDAILLIAHPAFRDMEYRQAVLIAAPAPNGGHVGVILNRPTRRSLGSLFPEHEMVFRKDTEGMWEELLQATKRIRADAGGAKASLIARQE